MTVCRPAGGFLHKKLAPKLIKGLISWIVIIKPQKSDQRKGLLTRD
ncbi:hypothetical protein MGA3_16126 [Bacillus methanolicus MGA3]|nr:hypothetical protein MGA3_16126 [Bacillus methanolicus MGA3]